MNAEQLYFIWLHFTGRDFEQKVRGKEISNEEFYKFIKMVKEFKHQMQYFDYDIGELRDRLERLMVKRYFPKKKRKGVLFV